MTARFLRFALLALAMGGSRLTAQTKAAPAQPPAEKLTALLREVQDLQMHKRSLEALAKLDEAEKLDPAKAQVHNIRGAIYLSSQVRDFDKARAEFKKALEIEPGAMGPQFNLAEEDYVQGRFADGEKGFADLLVKFPKLPLGVRHLVTFKQFVCLVKQGRLDEATKLLNDSFTFMDDTPAYYFCKAVLALDKNDEKTGKGWLAKVQAIFKRTETGAYLNTLIEGHYIDSAGMVKQPQ